MAYYPTPEHARTVEQWTRAGIGKERIAQRIGISVNQLEASYPYELGFTNDQAVAIVADVAYQMAVSGTQPTMTKWWLEVRAGWVTGQGVLAGAGQKPLTIMLDSDEVIEGDFEEMEESNVVELNTDP